jgi:hypothetical protein
MRIRDSYGELPACVAKAEWLNGAVTLTPARCGIARRRMAGIGAVYWAQLALISCQKRSKTEPEE